MRLVLMALLLAGCSVDYPDDVFVCEDDIDCPPNLVCMDGVCRREGRDGGRPDVGTDSGPEDVGVDSGADGGVDGGVDAAMVDAGCSRVEDCQPLFPCRDVQCVDGACVEGDMLPNNTECGAGGVEVCCGGSCVDTDDDRFNCGECGISCGAATCETPFCNAGTCDTREAVDGTACSSGRCCLGSCVDTQTEEAHCGGCRQSCSTGTCNLGQCSCVSASQCPNGADDWICTGSSCECENDNACALGQACVGGVCTYPP